MPDLIMMVGLPGSGKSRRAELLKKEYDAVLLNSDEYRSVLNVEEDSAEVRQRMRNDAAGILSEGRSVVFDAADLSSKRRRTILRAAEETDGRRICFLMMRTYDACRSSLKESASGEKEQILDKMYRSFETPYYCEGWDEICVVYPDGEENSRGPFEGITEIYMDYDQCNPHHGMTLGRHLTAVRDLLLDSGDPELITAGYLHDIGKPFCQTFADAKGGPSEFAHYFGHESVGAYEAMFFDMKGMDKLRISWLISNHMKPHEWKRSGSQKAFARAERQWGRQLYEEIMKLAEADDRCKISR